jgi:hypothetical protein
MREKTAPSSEGGAKSGAPVPKDPALAILIDAWPHLPAALRAGILAMVEAAMVVEQRQHRSAGPAAASFASLVEAKTLPHDADDTNDAFVKNQSRVLREGTR